jgi:Ca2+-binding RTX toxin-like protein
MVLGGNDTFNGSAGKDAFKGFAGDDTMTGGKGNDILRGGVGKDVLNGGDGNDRLVGEAGQDILTGGGGNDIFELNSKKGFDIITDFTNSRTTDPTTTNDDIIRIDGAVFTLTTAKGSVLSASEFAIGQATTTDQHIIYNETSGKLFYDADGSGTASHAVQIALIGTVNHTALSVADFFVIG